MIVGKQIMVWTGLALVLFVLGACAAPSSAEVTPPRPTTSSTSFTPVRLRITNTSATPLDQLIVMFPNEQIDFGAIPAGATTDFQPVQGGVYSYAAYRATINRQPLTQGGSDWLGEQPLVGTRFTYVLSINLQQPLAPISSEVQPE